MSTLLQEIGKMFQASGVSVQCTESEMLAVVRLTNGRNQTVKVTTLHNGHGNYWILRFQSRVCLVQDPATVRVALKANAALDCGAYALDTSCTPNVLDVVHGHIISPHSELDPGDIIGTLNRVAVFADTMEKQVTGGDVF
jgi:hypothetical protein